MNLEQAIAFTIQQEGSGIVDEKRFVNYLHDLGAFQQPAMKRIMSVMAEGGYCSKLLASMNNNTLSLVAKDIQMRLVQTEGLHVDMACEAVKAFCSAMGQPLSADTNMQNSSMVPNSQTSSQDNGFKATLVGDKYIVELNGKSYSLTSQQYKSILRKKNSPIHILESWLKSYTI